MKICSNCKLEKEESQFYKDFRDLERGREGLSSRCKDCSKESSRKWYQNSEKYRGIIRESGLKHRYGIDSDSYWNLSEIQNHVCAICKTKSEKYLHVDHDHVSGQIRGLLCKTCNHGLGNFKDNPILLKNAIEYLSDNNFV